jgi:hypothetical protein
MALIGTEDYFSQIAQIGTENLFLTDNTDWHRKFISHRWH